MRINTWHIIKIGPNPWRRDGTRKMPQLALFCPIHALTGKFKRCQGYPAFPKADSGIPKWEKLCISVCVLYNMILTEFPDLGWLKQQANSRFADRRAWQGKRLPEPGWPNVILNVSTAHTFRDNIRGPISIFTNLSGESNVVAEGRRVRIRENFFFVTNHDQRYTLEINQGKPVETFNIHFGEYFADQVFDSLTLPGDQLPDHEFQRPHDRFEFHNKLHVRDDFMDALLLAIKAQPSAEMCWQDERRYALMANLLAKEYDLQRMVARLPALKASTKTEISKRLFRVTDFIHSNLRENLSLESLAMAGCLSKFHLLRLFKIAFGKTPHQFINDERIHTGKQLIMKTRLEIHEIARSLGFDHPSSFSRMFYAKTGVYPSQLRPALP